MKKITVLFYLVILLFSAQAQNCRDTVEYFESTKTPFRKYTICDNRIEGLVVEFGYSGDTVLKMLYFNDTIRQSWHFHSKNRLASKENYRNGKLWNIELDMNLDGDTLGIGDFKDGFGTLYGFDDKGRIETVEYYEAGQAEGNLIYFNKGNHTAYITAFLHGKAVTKTLYKRNGRVWRKYYFQDDGITVKKMEELRKGKWTTYHPKKEE